MNFLHKYVFFIVLLAINGEVVAYNLRQINNKDGLSNSSILSLSQDEDGYLWIGTCDGLNTYDGLQVLPFKTGHKDGIDLSGNLIENIVNNNDKNLWIRTNYGLCVLNRETKQGTRFSRYDGEFFLQRNLYDDIILLRIDNKIIYYSKQNKKFYEFSIEGISFPSIRCVSIGADNRINIISTDGRIRIYEITYDIHNNPSINFCSEVSLNKRLMSCHTEANRNDIIYLIGEDKVLYQYNLVDKSCEYIFNIREEVARLGGISSVIKFNNDYFIGFTIGGLIRLSYTPDQFMRYQVEQINIQSGVLSMIKDKNQDLIWIGTDGQGVFMYTQDAFTIRSYTFNNFMPRLSKPIRSIFLDKKQNLWIGTKGDGIVRIHNYNINEEISQKRLDLFTKYNSELESNSVYAFAESSRNIFWIGTDEEVCYYSYKQDKIKKLLSKSSVDEIKNIHSILELNDTTLWLTSVGKGIFKITISGQEDHLQIEKIEQFKPYDNSYATNHFFRVYKEKDDVLWFANRGHGAFRYLLKTGVFTQYSFDKADKRPTLNDLFAVSQSKDGTLWFGSGGGLVKLQNGSSKVEYNEEKDLPNNTIHGILCDSKNTMWLSTNQGIVNFNPELNSFHIYNQHNGIKITEFSDDAFSKDTITNQLFFGGIDGFITINETTNSRKDYFPKVQFDNLVIFGKPENLHDYIVNSKEGQRLELKYNQNFFSLSFVAIDFVEGTNYSYLYKLEGLSDRWIENKNASKASFTSIPPGDYSLKIKYINRVTGKESSEYVLDIVIYPPWYKSTIAYIIYGLVFLATAFYAIHYLLSLNRRKKERMLKRLERIHKEEVHESKIRFFTNIAHEFCTPLTLIYGPCARILSHKGSDTFIKKYTTLIQRNAERLNDLIQELIEFRRIETDNRMPYIEDVNVTELAIHLTRNFEDQAEVRNIRYTKNIGIGIAWNLDKSFFTTIVINLLSNAFKYTTNDGEVGVVLSTDGVFLTLIISNTGKGINDTDPKLIFDKYNILDDFENQDSATSSRNGLGLAIVAGMVKLLKGTIDVKSEPNVKTDFIVQLPLSELDTNEVGANLNLYTELAIKKEYEPILELPEYIHSANNPTILIIDDDIEILWLIADVFRDEFNIKTSSSKISVDDVLTQYSPDIIVCDIGLNGIQFTKALKNNIKTSHIPVILISAKQAIEEQIEGLSAGAEMYIPKPFNVDYLKISVNHLINRKAVLQDYFSSPLSAFDLMGGKLTHQEDKKFVQKILDIINLNIANSKLSTQFIASEMSISTRHLYRKLEEMNMKDQSPTDMIRESRLHIAKNLLKNTTLTIEEIVYKSGFSNRATFFRQFSQKCNCTPKEFRDLSLKEMESKI